MSFLTGHDRNQARAMARHAGVANKLLRGIFGDSHASFTLTGDLTMTKSTHFTHRIIVITPDQARTLTLPAEAEMDGFLGVIINAAGAAYSLTIKEDAGSTTIATVDQNQGVVLGCDGTRWFGTIVTFSGIT